MSKNLTSKVLVFQGPSRTPTLVTKLAQNGLRVLTEFYNQKYPERGEIKSVIVNGTKEEAELELPELIEVLSTKSAEILAPIVQQKKPFEKIILASGMFDNGVLNHSDPILITREKLIVLRDFYDDADDASKKFFESVAKKLGLKLVAQRDPSKEDSDKSKTSIQASSRICHFISAGILKDLTLEDVEKVSAFEDGYTPLPKMLKYSQSLTHVTELLGEEKNAIVKKDGVGLTDYIKTHKEGTAGSRVTEKFIKFVADLEKLEGSSEDSASLATKILEKRTTEKADKTR